MQQSDGIPVAAQSGTAPNRNRNWNKSIKLNSKPGLRASPSLAPSTLVMADQAYDTNAARRQIGDRGAVPNIPPQVHMAMEELFQPGTLAGSQRH